MTEEELDALTRRVLLDSMEPALEPDPDSDPEREAEEASFTPSKRYERSIQAMLENPVRWANRRARPVWVRGLQRVAMLLLVCSLSFGSVLVVSPTVRAAVMRWAVELYENHMTYRYSGEMTDGQMPLYEITDLPEGYVEVREEREESPDFVFIVYRDEAAQKEIYLEYVFMQQGALSDFVTTEDMSILPVTVNGLEGQLFLRDDWSYKRNGITWIDPESNLQFTLHANLSELDILHTAESVSLVKTEK